MAFLEETDSLQTFNNLFPQAHAADLVNRYPSSYGRKLGIITDSENNPIQETETTVDLSILADGHQVFFSDSIEPITT